MKHVVALMTLFAISATVFAADMTWSGYLMDKKCATSIARKKLGDEKSLAKVKAHTKECALMEECVESGYGIWTEGKFVPFDDAGNKKASVLIDKTSKKDGLTVQVKGEMKGEKIAVSSLSE